MEETAFVVTNQTVSAQRRHLQNVPEYSTTLCERNTDSDGSDTNEPSPLHLLAINGNKLHLIEHINKRQWDINEVDHMGRTPLIYSVLGDRMDCVMVLLKSGADIDKPDIDERTALHWAAYQGNHKLVKLLLSKGADKIKIDKEGRTPLHFSTIHDNVKVIQALLKSLKEVEIDTPDNKKMTALCWSVFFDRMEYTKLLLKHGASPTSIDSDRRTVLHLTSQNKDATILKMLLDQDNTIINWQDGEGRTVLHMAVGQSNKVIVKYLLTLDYLDVNLQDEIQRTPLHWAAVLGNTDLVTMLLDCGADYTLGDKNGFRALHYAAQNDSQQTVCAMLDKDGVKDIPDNDQCTALMWASVKGCDNVLATLLLKKCSDVNAVDVHMQTALHMSTQAGHLNCVKLLLENGADVNMPDRKQHIPLFYACASGHASIVTELLRHGSTSEDKDLEGRCPLHYAAMVDRTDIVKILIQSKLNPDTKDNAGCPPLHFAAYGGFVHCMSVLLENGATVDSQDNDGRTALHWACRSGSLEAVKLLVSRYNAKVNVIEKNGGKLTPLDYAIIEDHQDVSCYLTENNADTIASLKDLIATKIQAIWKGYKFRKAFKDKRELLHKHQSLRQNDTMQIQDKPSVGWTEYKIYSDSIDKDNVQYQQEAYKENILSQQQLQQERKHSAVSYASSGNSSKCSYYAYQPLERGKDYRQGPKFGHQFSNPLSLSKTSPNYSKPTITYPSKPAAEQAFFNSSKEYNQNHWTTYKRFKTDVGLGHSACNNRNHAEHRRTGSPSSSTGSSEKAILLQRKSVDKNSFYSNSYSRYANEPKDVSTSSGSSAVFDTRPSKVLLPMLPKLKNSVSENTFNSKSVNLRDELKQQELTILSKDSDKPWDVYRRDQKRIDIIRKKTEAAITIQKTFRRYISHKHRSKVDNHKRNLASNVDQYTQDKRGFETFNRQVVKRLQRQDIVHSFNMDDIIDGSDVSNCSDEVPDNEALQEVAALVIQLAWRQYVKQKLLIQVQLEVVENNSIFSSNDEEVNENANLLDSTHNENVLDESSPGELVNSIHQNKKKPLNASFNEVEIYGRSDRKMKLAPTSSFPMMQNVCSQGMYKKRSNRFSLKKKFLRLTNSSSNPSSISNSPNLVTLTKSDVAALKTGKPKLFLKGRTVPHDPEMFS